MEFVKRLQQSGKMKNYSHKTISIGKNLAFTIFKIIILVGLAFVIISPLLGMISKSFKGQADIANPLVFMIPEHFTMYNFQQAFKLMKYPATLANTFFLCATLMFLQGFICSLVGYGFARFRFPGREVLFGIVIITIVVPVQTIMLPMYMQFQSFDVLGIIHAITGKGANLLGTMWPAILLTVTGSGLRAGLFIFIFRQFFRGLPKEIEEAAFIDGAGMFYTYARVMLPNAVPPMITVMLFSLVWQYNDTFYSSMYMTGINLMSTQIATVGSSFGALLKNSNGSLVELVINAGVILGILPIVIIYLVLQRYFMEGIERSGIVG